MRALRSRALHQPLSATTHSSQLSLLLQLRPQFHRNYKGQQQQGPHTTYFQEPPPNPRRGLRTLRTVLWSTTFIFLGAYANAWIYDVPLFGIGLSEDDLLAMESLAGGVGAGGEEDGVGGQEGLLRALAAGAQDTAARYVYL